MGFLGRYNGNIDSFNEEARRRFCWGIFFAAAVNPLIKDIKSIEMKGALRTLAGGTASRLGGGKFASCPSLAAMGFLFNEVLHQGGDKGNGGEYCAGEEGI